VRLGRTAVSFAWVWFAATASVAAAEESSPVGEGRVQLEVEACAAVPAAVVRRVVSVEIGDLLLDDAGGEPGAAERLIIRCAGNFASVEARGPSGEAPTERLRRLDDFPGDAAPRALALLGVELLAARSAAVRERILRRQVGASPAVPAVVITPAAPPGPAAREMRIGVAGVWRSFLQQAGASAFGGRLEVGTGATRRGLLTGDIELAVGSKDVINVGQTTASLLSSGVAFRLYAGRDRLRGEVGLGGRIGLVWESGSSADPAQVSASSFVRPWGGPMLNASLVTTLGHLALMMGGEAGWSLSSIDELAAGATAIAVRGPWVALSIGADLRR
jgi:hypothetical protein